MRTRPAHLWRGCGRLAGAALAILAWLATTGAARAAAEPKILTDTNPVPREGRGLATFAPIIKKVAPSVVTIYTTKIIKDDPRRQFFQDPFWRRFFGLEDEEAGPRRRPREFREQNLGSGVIVTSDGYILSNHHVVEGADELKVALAQGQTEYPAKLVGSDRPSDIAVLKIAATNLPAITLTDSDQLQVGDLVLALGNPFGVGQTVTMGIVSGLGRAMGIVDYEDFIQTDASINPGNSGGALVDAAGRLVGINTAILSRTGGNIGVGFAVPINMARNVMQQIIRSGKVSRGWLGVLIQPVTPQVQRAFNLPDQSGALVGDVTPKSPAAAAGIREGDVITEFNGKKVADNRQLRLMVSQTSPKAKVTVKLLRDGKEKTLTLTLGELPDNLAAADRPAEGGSGGSDLLEGVQLADLDNRSRRQFNIPAEVEGAVVTQVEEDSPAAQAGLQPGQVIVEVNHEKIRSADEAVEAAAKAKGPSLLLRVWSGGARRYVVIEEVKKPK